MEVVSRIFRKLREQQGEIALRLGFVLLGAVLLFMIIFNIRHAYQVIDMVIDRTNEAVMAVAAVNGPNTAHGIREGETVARIYNGSSWRHSTINSDVIRTLQRSLGGTASGQTLIREGNYRIDNLATSYVNADGNDLHFVTTMDLTISLMGGDTLTVTRHLEVRTTYEAKF